MKCEVRLRLVTKEREAHLKTFAASLADLCDKFSIDIEVDTDSEGVIDLIERNFKYPPGYEFSATFQGIDARGMYNTCNADCKRKPGPRINRWCFLESEEIGLWERGK